MEQVRECQQPRCCLLKQGEVGESVLEVKTLFCGDDEGVDGFLQAGV